MPKSTLISRQHHDYHHGQHYRGGLSPPSNTLQSMRSTANLATSMSSSSAPPRKVSFEDGHSDEGASTCSESSENVIMPLHYDQHQHRHHESEQENGQSTKEVRMSRSSSSHKPRLLTRHSPSLSLVDLAKTLAMDECNTAFDRSPKRPHSAPVSPVMGLSLDPQRCLVSSPSSHLLPPGMESTAEPWGHFVDMTLPEDKHKRHQQRVLPKTVPLSARASGKSKNRKRHQRRANPYGEYAKTKHPLCFQPSKNKPGPSLVAIPSCDSLFHLKPRNSNQTEPTELIAGDLERLHFR